MAKEIAPEYFPEGTYDGTKRREIDPTQEAALLWLLTKMWLDVSGTTWIKLEIRDWMLYSAQENSSLADQERRLISKALDTSKTRKEAAELLGMSERTLYRKINWENWKEED
jgi:DNA-binding NtrC family response regulator